MDTVLRRAITLSRARAPDPRSTSIAAARSRSSSAGSCPCGRSRSGARGSRRGRGTGAQARRRRVAGPSRAGPHGAARLQRRPPPPSPCWKRRRPGSRAPTRAWRHACALGCHRLPRPVRAARRPGRPGDHRRSGGRRSGGARPSPVGAADVRWGTEPAEVIRPVADEIVCCRAHRRPRAGGRRQALAVEDPGCRQAGAAAHPRPRRRRPTRPQCAPEPSPPVPLGRGIGLDEHRSAHGRQPGGPGEQSRRVAADPDVPVGEQHVPPPALAGNAGEHVPAHHHHPARPALRLRDRGVVHTQGRDTPARQPDQQPTGPQPRSTVGPVQRSSIQASSASAGPLHRRTGRTAWPPSLSRSVAPPAERRRTPGRPGAPSRHGHAPSSKTAVGDRPTGRRTSWSAARDGTQVGQRHCAVCSRRPSIRLLGQFEVRRRRGAAAAGVRARRVVLAYLLLHRAAAATAAAAGVRCSGPTRPRRRPGPTSAMSCTPCGAGCPTPTATSRSPRARCAGGPRRRTARRRRVRASCSTGTPPTYAGDRAAALRAAVGLYGGDLLEGCTTSGCSPSGSGCAAAPGRPGRARRPVRGRRRAGRGDPHAERLLRSTRFARRPTGS